MDYPKNPNFLSYFIGKKQLHTVDFMKIWTHYDKDSSGYLDRKEFSGFLKDFLEERNGTKPTDSQIKELTEDLIKKANVSRPGKIELNEFANLLPVEDNFMKKFSKRKELSRNEFNAIFEHYDLDGSGFIDGKELLALVRDIMAKTEPGLKGKEVDDYLSAALSVFDKNTDGRLSRKELGLLLSVEK